MKCADGALYDAKHDGKNRVTVRTAALMSDLLKEGSSGVNPGPQPRTERTGGQSDRPEASNRIGAAALIQSRAVVDPGGPV
jgi:hypothetical protein